MRVQGNINPDPVSISDYRPKPGMAEVRIRENVVPISDNLYEYDEYKILLPNVFGLKNTIMENLQSWLDTLRILEVSANASIIVGMRNEISEYEAALSEIEKALGVSV